ncbi:LLM class flavin-dependent oxidoreductase [Anaerobacillus alkaliphilus]|uniref:LLM class flavin-dependent oxidoreductase n=1 Tax=Anaerobacillus alkaliphilus TaxID=1548597 RepID=A0A4V1LH08_9BACI|nr:LLM class flavin-dependent oxidoreductase [Anaerobacillus alkaliphilus]RXJ04585.1 LLM class flavin-dependent oxidoreductase [Anaerobacillus alkaliphilus]
MRLSILDQAPVAANQTAELALSDSLKLAQLGEEYGFERYWIAEHHNFSGLACSAPEVMLAYIGANTSNIRIGSGAILLPHYKPYKVAELFHMLATLFPGRIDLGIGRAPGGSAEATNALSDNFLQQVWKMPNLVEELMMYVKQETELVKARPLPVTPPKTWLLGTSKKSAILAAEHGMAYAFGQFMSDNDGKEIIELYRGACKEKGQPSEVIITLSAICANTRKEAEEIAENSLLWFMKKDGKHGLNESERQEFEVQKKKMIIGDPKDVKERLKKVQQDYNADEIMLVTNTQSAEERFNSYKLVGELLRCQAPQKDKNT